MKSAEIMDFRSGTTYVCVVLRPYGRYERGKYDIEFDVALTVTESIETNKGVEGDGKISSKISVLTMNLGEGNLEGKGKYNREQNTSQSTVSRVKFGVHVFSDADKEAAKKRKWQPRNYSQKKVVQ